MTGTRKAFLYLFIGTNGTGKTTRIKELVEEIGSRVLIVPSNRLDDAWKGIPELTMRVFQDEDPISGKPIKAIRCPEMATFSGTRVFHIEDPRYLDAITDERHGFKNGVLVLDDFRNYIPSKGQLPPAVVKMLVGRRHRMLDICMAAHAFQDMNLQLMQFSPELYVFRTTLPPNDAVEGKVADWQGLLDVASRVNRIAAKLELPEDRFYYERFIPA